MLSAVWVRRIILAAMLLVSYLLVLAWQKDYAGVKTTTPAAVTSSVNAATSATSDLPAQTNAVANNADVPLATPQTAIAPTTAQAANTTAVASARNIVVQSDVLRAEIDPVGGDVVSVKLLAHRNEQQHPEPFELLSNRADRVFVAQSGLIGANGPDQQAQRPTYTATQQQFTMVAGQKMLEVPLQYTTATGVRIVKTYRFYAGQYAVDVAYNIHNTTTTPWQGQMFSQFKRDNANDPSKATQGFGGMATFLGGAWGNAELPYNKVKLKNFADDAVNQSVTGGYAALVQHYFVSAWVPDATARTTISTRINNGNNIISMLYDPINLGAGQSTQVHTKLYVGPKDQYALKTLRQGLEQTVDYGWLWPIAKLLFWGLDKIHNGIDVGALKIPGVGNWGWAIVLLTLVVKALLWPLSAKSARSTAKMRQIAPQLQALKEKHGDDRQTFAAEMMKLYQKENVSLVSGCFPLLLQMPIFLALYWVLMESVELRHAPWLGWITDLSAFDPWFILPLIMGVTMYALQLMQPEPTDPMQAKVMKFMPIVFTAFMIFFPAGLVLYWIVNNTISVIQQWLVTNSIAKAG